jgi:hypothetical protein
VDGIDAEPASLADLFPGWDRHDRFGVVIDRPMGAVGASLPIQAAICLFFDTLRTGGPLPRVYPEVYYFHVGRRHGDFSNCDAWPPYKEVLVEDRAELCRMLVERAITWLAVPDRSDYRRSSATSRTSYLPHWAVAYVVDSCIARTPGR